jgi:predicted small secreted protein
MKKVSLALALTLAVLSSAVLSACNTTEGMGQDVKAAGQGIANGGQDLSNSAERNK